jgi:cold shock CspA family protein
MENCLSLGLFTQARILHLLTYACNHIRIRRINDSEVSTLPYGTVRWFNTKTGAGFIRTDDGEHVLFLNDAIQDSDPSSIRRGARVSLDVLKSNYGLTAINVRVAELQECLE